MILSRFVANDIEKSFAYQKNGLRTNLSLLSPAGNDPECIHYAQYQDDQDDPIVDVKFYGDEMKFLRELLGI